MIRNFIRKYKKTELTNEEKVTQSKQKVQGALSTFTRIYTDLEEANTTLATVITDDTHAVDSLKDNIAYANAELVTNKELQEKLKPFIKGESL